MLIIQRCLIIFSKLIFKQSSFSQVSNLLSHKQGLQLTLFFIAIKLSDFGNNFSSLVGPNIAIVVVFVATPMCIGAESEQIKVSDCFISFTKSYILYHIFLNLYSIFFVNIAKNLYFVKNRQYIPLTLLNFCYSIIVDTNLKKA